MNKFALRLWITPLMLFGLAGLASAETQNVKVSGSIDAYSFYRNNFDLLDNNDAGVTPAGSALPGQSHTGSAVQSSEAENFFMTVTQLEVDASLTDNVSTVINLINQREWNVIPLTPAGAAVAAATATGNEFDILVDLAYVQMKEIFYSPLTLTIGRQDLLFGRGFIVGWNPQDPQANLQADEFTQMQAFDAIRATLDFSPWILDFVYSKISEGTPNPENDRDLYIAYMTYKFAEYSAVADLYYTGDFDRATLAAAGGTNDNSTNTVGGRVQFDPISQITLGGELAYQFGDYRAALGAPSRDRDAMGVDLFGEYRWDNTWKPTLGLQYVYLEGENDLGAGSTQSYGSWNGSFRGPIYGWYHDYKEVYWATAATNDQAAGQNQQHVSLYGSILPMEDLKLTGAFWHFWATDEMHATITDASTTVLSSDIGNELDLSVVYSYTEDVTFTVMADWFVPGDLYTTPNNATATQIVSEVKVTF